MPNRVGLIRGANSVMVIEKSDEDIHLLRREMDRLYQERLAHLESRLEGLEQRVDEELVETKAVMRTMTAQVQKIIDYQHRHEPAMDSFESVVKAGLVLRWIILFVVGTLAAIGTTATAWEAIQKWIK